MIKLADVLKEIKKEVNEISDSKYSSYKLVYEKGKKTHMTDKYLKVTDFIDDNKIDSYELYGRKFDPKSHSNEWEMIETV